MSTSLPNAVELPGGGWVRGRALRRPLTEKPYPTFGLYLGSRRLRRRHEAAMPWEQEWLDWPDFYVPLDRAQATAAITDLHRRIVEGQRAEVACNGGVGRTGTVLACLAVLAGLAADQAVTWARGHHNRHAVETPWQRRWVTDFARSHGTH